MFKPAFASKSLATRRAWQIASRSRRHVYEALFPTLMLIPLPSLSPLVAHKSCAADRKSLASPPTNGSLLVAHDAASVASFDDATGMFSSVFVRGEFRLKYVFSMEVNFD